MDQLSSPSSYESPPAEDGGQGILPSAVGKFVKCGHTLHMLCMLAMYNNGTKVAERQNVHVRQIASGSRGVINQIGFI